MTRRLGQAAQGAVRPAAAEGLSRGHSANALPRRTGAPIVRLLALVLALGAIAIAATPAQAVTFVNPVSHNVAMIPTNLSGDSPTDKYNNLPVSTFVFGFTSESFGQFSFTNVPLNQVTSANLSHYDTAVLNQVPTSSLSGTAKTALAQFVASGGKLIIKDSDETALNDYSWLFLGSPYSTQTGAAQHPLGERGGTSSITNSTLLSTNPADSSYVDLFDMSTFTDAVADSNLLVSNDPRWFILGNGTDARHNKGAQLAYASSNNGLVIYDGYDTSFIVQHATDPFGPPPAQGPFQTQCTLTSPCPIPHSNPIMFYPTGSTVAKDWLAQMWYHQLLQPWGTPGGSGGGGGTGGGGTGGGGGAGLPHNTPLATVGTPLAARLAGLPSNRLCVPSRRLALALKKLRHLHGRQVVRIDVFVNAKLVRTQRGHFRNITLKHLPRHGRYTVEVIATTNLGFQLIAHRRYHEC